MLYLRVRIAKEGVVHFYARRYLAAGRPQGSPLPRHDGLLQRSWVGATLAVALHKNELHPLKETSLQVQPLQGILVSEVERLFGCDL